MSDRELLAKLETQSFSIEKIKGAFELMREPLAKSVVEKIRTMDEHPLEESDFNLLYYVIRTMLLSPDLKKGRVIDIDLSPLNKDHVMVTVDMSDTSSGLMEDFPIK